MRLFDLISHWLGRVEIAFAFADDALREGERALASGDPLRAEAAAKLVLERVPGSILALALLADAREAAGLSEDLVATLEELSQRMPSRAEVWARLGAARKAIGGAPSGVREAYVRALGVAAPGSEVRREALLALCDLDLQEGDVARAELWLAGIAPGSLEAAIRQAEIDLSRQDAAAALRELERVPTDDATDARYAMAYARALAQAGRPEAYQSATRAYVLEAPGSSELLSSVLAWIPSDEATRARLRALVTARGEIDLARWRAAFARAEGLRDEARAALRDALAGGETSAALPLLEAALDDRDAPSVALALAALPESERTPLAVEAAVVSESAALAEDAPTERVLTALEALSRLESVRIDAYRAEAMKSLAERFLAPAGTSRWPLVLQRLDRDARALHDVEGIARAAELAVESTRPVRLAVVGEFNAGKSTFVNALIGQDVAPTGVLPTTATLHHLRYGADPLARIELSTRADGDGAKSESSAAPRTRIVPLAELRKTIESLGEAAVHRVDIELPFAFLTRVEILDTPGFNAPNQRHTEAARRALEEADLLLWLLDASQPLKQSERVVLEEARAARIPIQILIGKSDRIAEHDRKTILDMVTSALAETGLSSLWPPVLFSARLALAGKLGQEGALEKSAWPEVQAILDDVVARSDSLKERALRRRARGLVERLLGEATTSARTDEAESKRVAARSRTLAGIAAGLERDADTTASALARSLEAAEAELDRDLAVTDVAPTVRSATGAQQRLDSDIDGTLLRYRTQRALVHLAPTLAAAMAGMARGSELAPRDFTSLARLLVRSVVIASPPRAALRDPLARASVLALSEHLRGLAVIPDVSRLGAGLERELRTFLEALA